MKPLQVDIFGSEPDEYIVRCFDSIIVATFEDGVNQFAGLCSSLCALNLVQGMKFTVQTHFRFVWFSLTLYLFFVTALFTRADPRWVEVAPSSLPLVYVSCMFGQRFQAFHKFLL